MFTCHVIQYKTVQRVGDLLSTPAFGEELREQIFVELAYHNLSTQSDKYMREVNRLAEGRVKSVMPRGATRWIVAIRLHEIVTDLGLR